MSSFTQSTGLTQQSDNSQSSQSSQSKPTTYTIGGVKVVFPTKAYPSQLAMMSKVIQGLKNKHNCLLESPTGSGKSLALLCAALAWQRHEAVRVGKYNAEIDLRWAELHAQQQQAKREEHQAKVLQYLQQREASKKLLESNAVTKEVIEKEDLNSSLMTSDSLLTSDESINDNSSLSVNDLLTDDEDDFQPSKKPNRTFTSPKIKESVDDVKPDLTRERKIPQMEPVNLEDNYVSVPAEKKLTVPKIYFGTRTHKQISQITRELRKTAYRTSRSVVLASREHTCVNPVVERVSNKNEACRELMDHGGGCGWHAKARTMGNFGALAKMGVSTAYDLEDLVAAGRHARACPYFMSRYLMEQADIIFCPYNYLIDPSIRRQMSLDLENQIVIFDEAHNMEDASREASSFFVYQDDMHSAMQDFEKVGNKGDFEPFAHQKLAQFLSTMSGWMSSFANQLQSIGFDSSGKHWTGTDFIAEVEVAGLTKDVVKMNLDYFKVILAHREEEYEKQKERGGMRYYEDMKSQLLALTIRTMEDVFRIFESLDSDNGKRRNDFRVALLKNTVRRRRDALLSGMSSKEVISLNIWCLNPAVAFAAVKNEVHSIVLTSGTLSPMQSFQSELDCPFQIKLEASHVIDRSQVFASILGVGPNNCKLNGSYRNVETFQYQDELGILVLNVCQKMPFGVLCFFPSYRLLEKVTDRWQSTGLWMQLNRVKSVVVEPRTGVTDFDEAISQFYTANEESTCQQTGQSGGLFFAVCRGKVSEGIDFADNNARAVICIGIPFPAFKDLQVELKRGYNQQNQSRGLLSGGEWYEIQAFRALNQALGRCIRHRHDWGAILLVDERFVQTPRYVASLSKWVRNSIQTFNCWEPYMRNLIQFKDDMLARPIAEPSFNVIDISSSSNTLEEMPYEGGGDINKTTFYGEKKDDSRIFNFVQNEPNTKINIFSSTSVDTSGLDCSNATPVKKGMQLNKSSPKSQGLTIPQLFANQKQAAKRLRRDGNW